MELTVSIGGSVRLRMPLREALAWMSAALAESDGDVAAAQDALYRAVDSYQRRIA